MRVVVTDTRYVDLDFVNARNILVTHNFEVPKIIKENNIITELHFGTYTIKIGSILKICVSKNNNNKTKNFKVNKIFENINGFNILSDTITNSSLFLFPLIGDKNDISQLYEFDTYFYNAYLYNENIPEYNDGKHLFVLYRFFEDDRFKELESLVLKNKNYLKTVEPNSDFTMYIFEIPKLLQSDAYFFRKGKYSKISTTGKSKITTFHRLSKEDVLYKVLYRIDSYKQQLEYELDCTIPENIDWWSKPTKMEETYND